QSILKAYLSTFSEERGRGGGPCKLTGARSWSVPSKSVNIFKSSRHLLFASTKPMNRQSVNGFGGYTRFEKILHLRGLESCGEKYSRDTQAYA
ncbi:unnamed protein product, partial [Hymenolepis diminuta]